MYEQEKQRQTHLMILLCYTIYTLALVPHSVINGWDQGAVVLIILGLIASWVMHITEKIPAVTRLWLYIILMMLTFFFYGIHETSVYNLATVMTAIILVYSPTNDCRFVRVCAISYYLTMFYDFVFVLDFSKIPMYEMERIILHFVIVLIAERLIETMIHWRWKDRIHVNEQISLLEENNRRAEDFLANMSHELRTPINAVMGITTVMLKNEEDSEKQKDILSVQMAGNRLFSQIEDILDFTEIDTGSVSVMEESYALPSLINDFIIRNRLMFGDKDVELIFDIDSNIPAMLVGDEGKIKKILKHLVDNAIKFTKKGGVYVRIYALHKPYGINLCIQISDTGIGITKEEMGKIKEKFFQANGGRNRKNSGLGLGICIVYGMVSAMNGFMQMESTVGKGTTVSISIPQKVADATPCIRLTDQANICFACYLRQEKYEVPEVRDYYNTVISHMVRELELTLYRVFYLDELKKLVSVYELTHLVVGREEYEEDSSYFEGLDKEIEVIVVADEGFRPAENSRVKIIRKPFYCLPIVNILNSKASLENDISEKYMICPGVRVLVVDDEPMNLMVAEGVFQSYQMEVATAWSGMEAIEICEKEEFDLVFLDHMMPEMDGVETLKRLQKKHTDTSHIPTYIAFTANAVSGAREMFLQEGFDEFISKPIEDQELKRLLRKVLPNTSIEYIKEEDMKKQPRKERNKKPEQTGKEHTDTGEPSQADESENGVDSGSEKGMLAHLEEHGINTDAGLVYCRSDEEYYEKVLILFANSAEGKIANIEDYYEKEDYKNYQIAIHALKSSAKTLGADMLSEMAKKAEFAAKDLDGDYIKEHHREIMDKYQDTVRTILEVLAPEESVREEPASGGISVSKEELLEHMSELKKRLDTFEANEAEEQLQAMREFVYQDTSVSGLLRDVSQDVENFDLMAAAEKVEAIIISVEGGEV